MRIKRVVRVYNDCTNIRDEVCLRIEEYMNLHNIVHHPDIKTTGRRDIPNIRYL